MIFVRFELVAVSALGLPPSRLEAETKLGSPLWLQDMLEKSGLLGREKRGALTLVGSICISQTFANQTFGKGDPIMIPFLVGSESKKGTVALMIVIWLGM